jgi:hypothetical protein
MRGRDVRKFTCKEEEEEESERDALLGRSYCTNSLEMWAYDSHL